MYFLVPNLQYLKDQINTRYPIEFSSALGLAADCMQDALPRARTRSQAESIRYLVYNVYKSAECAHELRHLV